MTTDDFYRVVAQLQAAKNYVDIFTDGNATRIKSTYRELVRCIHPDTVRPEFRDQASEFTMLLADYRRQADTALAKGTFGSVVTQLTFMSSSGVHTVDHKVDRWADMSACYKARTVIADREVRSFLKIAKKRIDNDLLSNEAGVLELLWSGDEKRAIFFPRLIDSFGINTGADRLRANVTEWCDGFVNLEEVRAVYTDGVDPLDMTWMWRSILWALDYAHQNNVVHGAVLPQNIFIHPAMHGVIIADWCYSVKRRSGAYAPLVAIVGCHRSWYPTDVLARKPYTPMHDVALAAKTMVWLMGADPQRDATPPVVPALMRDYFDSLMAETSGFKTVAEVAIEFDTLLRRLGPPYHPRAFRSFSLNP